MDVTPNETRGKTEKIIPMKLSYILVFVFFISLVPQFCYAQNPGFAGRNFSVHYNYSFSLGKHPRYNSVRFEKKGVRDLIGGQHNLELEHSINRRLAIGANYFIFRSGYAIGAYRFNGQQTHSYNISQQAVGLFTRLYFVKLTGKRKPGQGAIAPLGLYISPHILLSFDHYEIVPNPDFFNANPIVLKSEKSKHLGGLIKVGRHTPLFDRVILDVAISIGGFIPNPTDKNGLIYGKKLYSINIPYQRILLHHMYNIHIGIGYALF